MYCLVCSDFFFNHTATTEIYTYLHTLSLHYALPIGRTRRLAPPCAPTSPCGCRRWWRTGSRIRAVRWPGRPAADGPAPPPSTDRNPATTHRRSEEHTSELQSLMRISYAVFCLNNTKTATSSSQHHTQNYPKHT